jgi:serine/threonine-protein kinase
MFDARDRPYIPTLRLNAALPERDCVDRELGADGVATVYLAKDLSHDRKVAIKAVRLELAAVIWAEELRREWRAESKK